MFAYVVIAALHGLAPQLWERSFGGEEYRGPFRLLIFTPTFAVLCLILVLAAIFGPANEVKPEEFCTLRFKCLRSAWSLRGPPPG